MREHRCKMQRMADEMSYRETRQLQSKRHHHISLLFALTLICSWTSFVQADSVLGAVPAVLSFEDPAELSYFKVPATSNVTTSPKHYKDGFHSLVWQWHTGDILTLPLGRRLSGKGVGIKLWIYRNQTTRGNLAISLVDSSKSYTVIRFNFSMNYKGWRAAWVGIREAESLPREPGYDQVEFHAPTTNTSSNVLFLDLLCLATKVEKQSRDHIVPPIGKSLYTIANFWQQVYKWSLVVPHPVDGTTPLTKEEKQQLKDISLIEKRLVNWFANESLGPSRYTGNLRKRWDSLLYHIQCAKTGIKTLNITSSKDGSLTGSPLFSKVSEFGNSHKIGGNKKLGWVTNQIFFPLSLEYYFSTKPQQKKDQVAEEMKNVNNVYKRDEAVARITNNDEQLAQALFLELQAIKRPVDELGMRNILDRLNKKKLETIFQLLDYITDQGWTAGSAFGSLDHEMNKAGSGFMHSLFLLKPELEQRGTLGDIIKTMKWYNGFGEVYQNHFEYNGTTADRMRTIMLYRLETIFMLPEGSIREQREKLRDMAAYRRWSENALLINTAFEGIFKPDLSCFHHLGEYGSAYSPEALTIASLVYYLLDGTSYALSSNSRKNIVERLESYQIIAVRYSVPNSISGRFPGYSKSILIRMLSAFSVLSAGPQYLTPEGTLQGVHLGSDQEMTQRFLRLYDPENPNVVAYLRNGSTDPDIEYLVSIGALQITEAISSEARRASVSARTSPTGHWVQNYAALAIHRRRDWAVSMRGFSRYVWDYESSDTENRYGLYQSHGALQISNSEESLLAYDVENGWDWTRIPGTTTVKMDLEQMAGSGSARYYQHSKLVGGVRMVSKDAKLANGGFAMQFQQPLYDRPEHTYRGSIEFRFKKSVFFCGNLVVCLGSDVHANHSYPNRTQTTLFQDKLVPPSETAVIYVNGVNKWLNHDLMLMINESAAMLDTNGNGYYVPSDSSLNVEISRQMSRTSSGLKTSSARYATTWLDHGIDPTGDHYEYAILVSSSVAEIEALKVAQSSSSPRYVVLQKNAQAHVVEFAETVSGSKLYGYAFYDHNCVTEGPVVNASVECIVMAEVDRASYSSINLSISSPDLNFNTSKVLNYSDDSGVNEYFYMRSRPVEITVALRHPVFLDVQRVLVNGRVQERPNIDDYVEVIPDDPEHIERGGRRVVFKMLVDGYSAEVYLIGSIELKA